MNGSEWPVAEQWSVMETKEVAKYFLSCGPLAFF
jgi:hypothetical protein